MGHSGLTRNRGRASIVTLVLAAALAVALVAALPSDSAPVAAKPKTPKLAHINHFFVIVLENEDAASTFGPTTEAPYLAKTLVKKGAYLPNYYGTGHNSLDDYLSMVSGQAPNPVTQADCPVFTEFTPGAPSPGGQYTGTGCVYPSSVKTVADQLTARKLGWKGFMQDMANATASGQSATCRHPDIGALDTTLRARIGDQYATRHNPFVYFHSIIDSSSCKANDVDLTKLPALLKTAAKTPAYTFITPNLCQDGHDSPCVDGQPGGLVSANLFLKKWVPIIMKSPGYKDHGMILVTFDEAEAGGADADSSSCCDEPTGPNTAAPGGTGPGGGKVGAVALSPCIKPGTVAKRPYNHYSQLRWVEDNFGLKRLGYAAQAGLASFGRDVFTRPDCGDKPPKH